MSDTGPSDELASREGFARTIGVDRENVPVLHAHLNPETGQIATASCPCPQCIALGRTGPLRYGADVSEQGAGMATEIPPDRLDAYLASFRPQASHEPTSTGGHRARRRARRRAERERGRRKH